MTHYSVVRVGDICDLVNGRAFKPEDWSAEGTPIIRIQNLNDSGKPFNYWAGPLDRQVLVKPLDVLLAWSGTPGTSFGAHIWRGVPGILNQHIFRVDLDVRRVSKEWWVRAVNARLSVLIGQAHGGVGLKHVTRGMVDNLEIPLPPLSEQKRVAAILDQADELRRKRRSTLAQLRTLPQAIFSQMFERSSSLRTGWTYVKLADVVRADDRINYGVVQPGEESEKGIPLVRVANIVDNDFSSRSLKKIDPSIEAQYRRSRLHGDEILVACVGSIGAVALASPGLRGTNIARAVARVRVDANKADRTYVAEFLRLSQTQRYFQAETRAVAQPTLNIKQLSETPILLPPLAMQKKFSECILETTRLHAVFVSHLSAIDTLFASLQHRAFRGELTAKAVERELAEAS